MTVGVDQYWILEIDPVAVVPQASAVREMVRRAAERRSGSDVAGNGNRWTSMAPHSIFESFRPGWQVLLKGVHSGNHLATWNRD